MSSKSIRAYDGYRAAVTLPPPPLGVVTSSELEMLAAQLQADASRMLARAADLRAVASKLRGES